MVVAWLLLLIALDWKVSETLWEKGIDITWNAFTIIDDLDIANYSV